MKVSRQSAREKALVRVVRFYLRLGALCDCDGNDDDQSHAHDCMSRVKE